MKKLLLPLLILALVSFCAVGETLYCASEDAVFAAELSSEIVETDSRLDALDALTNGGAALLTQQELIEALQGYSEVDVTTDIQLIRLLGQGALYVVCSAETAGDMRTLGDLVKYLEENEYALSIMRCFEASVEDYASMVLMDTLPLDSEMFVDAQDKEDCLRDGAYILVVDEISAVVLGNEGCVVLGALTNERTNAFPSLPCAGECGLPAVRGTLYALYALSGAEESAYSDAEFSPDTLEELYLTAPDADISLEEEISRYVDYMTAEGLFFY